MDTKWYVWHAGQDLLNADEFISEQAAIDWIWSPVGGGCRFQSEFEAGWFIASEEEHAELVQTLIKD